MEGKKGVAKIQREYNSQRELTEEKYFDKNDKEAALPDGMVRGTISYDESGKNIKMVTIYGQASIPGTKVARFIRKLNFAFQTFEEHYFDAQGNPANNIRGIHTVSISYDASRKKKLKEVFYGKDIDGEKNITKKEKTYDSQGRQLTEAYYGKDGKPTVNKNSISHWENIYDSVTKKLKKNILYSLPGYGVWGYKNVMRVEREYNAAGKIIKQSYFDKAGKAITTVR